MNLKIVWLPVLLFLSTAAFAKLPAEEGKTIFTSRCAGCHNVNKTLTGPALAGVDQRRSLDWIVQFVRSSQTVIKQGDKDAVALFNQFNRIPMPDHSDLTEEHIKSILDYVKAETVAVDNSVPFAKPGKLRPLYTPLTLNDYPIFAGFLALVAVLIASLVFAVRVKSLQRDKI